MELTRQGLFQILHKPTPSSAAARYVNYFLAAVILANCAAVAFETVPSIYEPHKTAFEIFEAISTALFVVEYGFRIWVCVEQTRFSRPVVGRLRYAISPLPLLDLLVILTYWAPADFRFLRIFRITRLLRVMRLETLDHSLHSIAHAVGRRKHLLVVSVMMMVITAYCFAALLYVVEHATQPDKFSSIPETIWWSLITLTTIGYGDITPITTLGKFLTGGIILVAIGVFALPAAIMTAAILEAGVDRNNRCPHCGNDL